MAISSLRNIVDGSFVRKFQGLATGTSATTKGASSSTTIQNGLRVGAQTFARAVQGLNGVISYLNVGKSTLEGLIDITDKMVDLTKRATRVSTSADARDNLNGQFFKLARDYEKIVSNAKFGDRDLLTTEGISGIFQVLGLDKSASDSIAAVFEKFVVPKRDDNLASEKAKGTRPYAVPVGAYVSAISDTPYVLSKVTDSNPDSGYVSEAGAIFSQVDDILNQNPGDKVIFNVAANGSLTSMEAGTVSTDVTIRGANATNGYSVFESTDDFLATNPSGYNQVYVADAEGNVIHQVTNSASGGITFGELAFTTDNKTFVIEELDGGVRSLKTYEAATLGDDPAISTVNTIDVLTAADDLSQLSIDATGAYISYNRDATGSGGSLQTYFMEVATLTVDPWLSSQAAAEAIRLGDTDQIVLQFANGGNKDLRLYDYGSSAYTSFVTNQPISNFSSVQRTTGTQGYVSYIDTTQNAVVMYGTSDGTTPVMTYDFEAGDSIVISNMAYDSAGEPQVGVFGSIPSKSGDTDNELYRLGANSQASTGRRLARSTEEYEEIFDKTLDLKTRPDAFRMLHDLEGLQKQLKDNVKAIDNALEVVGQNTDLVRAAGFAFLDLSNQVSDSRDADQIAEDLRVRIRKDAKTAISQAENLQAIVVAALAFDSEDLTRNT